MQASMYMPPPAMHHAKIAPKGPIARPKVRGNEKMPKPTNDPITIAVRANKESFGAGCDVISSLSKCQPAKTLVSRLRLCVKLDRLQLQRNCSRITTLPQGRIPLRLAHSR
jgi:hypothetical protein